jgi:hypothetical protein
MIHPFSFFLYRAYAAGYRRRRVTWALHWSLLTRRLHPGVNVQNASVVSTPAPSPPTAAEAPAPTEAAATTAAAEAPTAATKAAATTTAAEVPATPSKLSTPACRTALAGATHIAAPPHSLERAGLSASTTSVTEATPVAQATSVTHTAPVPQATPVTYTSLADPVCSTTPQLLPPTLRAATESFP